MRTGLQTRAHAVLAHILAAPPALHVVRLECFGMPFGASAFYASVLRGHSALTDWPYALAPWTLEEALDAAQTPEMHELLLAHGEPLPPRPVECWNGRRVGLTTLIAQFCAEQCEPRAATARRLLVLSSTGRLLAQVRNKTFEEAAAGGGSVGVHDNVDFIDTRTPLRDVRVPDMVLIDGDACEHEAAIAALRSAMPDARVVALPNAPTPWLDTLGGATPHLLRSGQ